MVMSGSIPQMNETPVHALSCTWCRGCRMPALLIALLAAGCQTAEREWREGPTEEQASASGSPAAWREFNMNRRWQNRPLRELTSAMGEPRLIMDIPGGGNPPGFVVVYGTDAGSGCTDAFALMHGSDPVVRVYHCR